MEIRTDLALEARELVKEDIKGMKMTTESTANMKITKMEVLSQSAAESLGKDKGTYITCEFKALTADFTAADERLDIIGRQIRELVPKSGTALVVGIGNHNITPDALGPLAAAKVLATRHISGDLAQSLGLDKLRSVCVVSPGVLGQTGIEVSELISGIIEKTGASCIIAVDALASRRLNRLGCTVQISDTGISPGAGVGNNRRVISKKTTGIPVIGIGVPTVVDAATLAADLLSPDSEEDGEKLRAMVEPKGQMMVVTPREIDLLIERASFLIGMAINVALHPDFTAEELLELSK
ncbi:MAG: GPR endopeptidase [Lachnospiraceae bacterium]|nr:GPR endopeptidase [Lachnospiraceae bacterium]